MRIHIIAAVVALTAALGCSESLDPATPEGALHLLRDAVIAKDATRLLQASSTATRDKLAKLQVALKSQRDAIETKYPADHKATAYAVIPKAALEAKDAETLFIALVTPQLEAMEVSEGLRYGMSVKGRVQRDGDHAKVTTQSQEVVEFVFEDGLWKTTIFERQLDQNLDRTDVNARSLAENLKVLEELKRRADRRARPAPAPAP